jgi:hypothetical protein
VEQQNNNKRCDEQTRHADNPIHWLLAQKAVAVTHLTILAVLIRKYGENTCCIFFGSVGRCEEFW